MSFLRTPDEKQLKAINHDSGPALVLAGPGSGKTFTIVSHIQYLIRNKKIPPEEILVVTFSKAAAIEMQTRYLESADSNPSTNPVRFGTFHSLGYQILRSTGQFRNFSLITDKQKYHFLEVILKNEGLSSLCTHDQEAILLNALAARKAGGIEKTSLELLDVETPGFDAEKLFALYQSDLEERRLLDYDDLILKCIEMLKKSPALLGQYQQLFTHILVDEFQDINASQYELITMLALPQKELFVVGDDDQSIYGFRGSRPEFMREFLQQYTDVKRYELTANYRSGERIVALGRKIIEQNKERFPKEFLPKKKGGEVSFQHLNTRREEEELLVQDIRRNSMECLDQTAIIVRTNLEARQYEVLLKGKQFPVAGSVKKEQGVFQSEIAEDLYAFLRFLYEGGHRKDFMRIMDKLEPDLTRKALVSEIVSEEELMCYYRNNVEMRGQIRKLFSKLVLAGRLQTHLAIRLFRNEIGYDSYLKKKSRSYLEYEDKKKMAQTVQEVFASYQRTKPLDEFILQCQEKENKSPIAEQRKGIHVITMHASKGLEFQHVYLPDLNEGIIPPKGVLDEKQIEEERRLLYVAVTRAREKLFLYETRERNRKVTRFLVL